MKRKKNYKPLDLAEPFNKFVHCLYWFMAILMRFFLSSLAGFGCFWFFTMIPNVGYKSMATDLFWSMWIGVGTMVLLCIDWFDERLFKYKEKKNGRRTKKTRR